MLVLKIKIIRESCISDLEDRVNDFLVLRPSDCVKSVEVHRTASGNLEAVIVYTVELK